MKAKKQWITPEVTELEINNAGLNNNDGSTNGKT